MNADELLAAVRAFAQGPLAEKAEAIDREGYYPKAELKKLAHLGTMSAHLEAPHGVGDFGLAIRAMAEVSKVCGATGFMVWCQAVCGLYLQQSGNPALMGEALQRHVTGLGLGVIEGFTKVFYPEASNVVVFVIMAIVLMVRPAGLFGKEA